MRSLILFFLALFCINSNASAQIPSWHAVDGPIMQGGIFYDFVQKSDGTIFTTSEVNGVYRSTDDGKSWKQCIKGLRNCEGVSLALSPKGTLFCSNINAGLQPNIYRSLNNGDSWEEITISVQSTRTFAPRHIYCAANGMLFATTSQLGILRSTDDGLTWEIKTNGMTGSLACRGLGTLPNGDLYTVKAVEGLMYISSDNGENWVKTTGTIPVQDEINTFRHVFVITTAASGSIYSTMFQSPYIFRTSDKGITWDSIAYNLPIGDDFQAASGLCVDKSGTVYTSVRQKGIYKLITNSTTWQALPQEPTGPSDCFALFITKNGTLLNGGPNGLFRMASGASVWEDVTGIKYSYIDGIAATEDKYFMLQGDWLYTSDKSSIAFMPVSGLPTVRKFYELAAKNNSVVIASNDSIYASSTGGQSWKGHSLPEGILPLSISTIAVRDQQIVLSIEDTATDVDGNFLYSLFYSKDLGANWSPLTFSNNPLNQWGYASIYLGDGEIIVVADDRVMRSTNEGQSFDFFETGLPLLSGIIDIASLDNGNRYLLSSDNIIYRSDAGSQEWNEHGFQIQDTLLGDLKVLEAPKAGTSQKLIAINALNNNFYLSDGASAWEDISIKFPFTQPRIVGAVLVAEDATHPFIMVGTAGMGLWTGSRQSLAVDGEEVNDANFNIHPNPSSDNITLEIKDWNAETKSADLFDILGNRAISTTRIESAVTVIDCAHLTSGMYRLSISTGKTKRNSTVMIVH